MRCYVTMVAASAALLALGTGCPSETEPNPVPEPEGLEPPPQGEGVQFGTGEQPVAAGDEVQNCFFFKVSDLAAQAGLDPTKPLNLSRVEMWQATGSHHMNVFRVRTIVPGEIGLDPAHGPYLNKNGQGACFNSAAWADWPLIANSQTDGNLDWEFPEGVANRLQPDEYLMVQSHYVNASTQDTPKGSGEVLINFWHMAEEKIVHEMGTLFATKQSIRVCQSNPAPQFQGSCQMATGGQPVTVVGANGHFHSRGKQFEIFSWDGQSLSPDAASKFYSSSDWEEPDMSYADSLAQVPANGGVFYTCGYQWTPPPADIGCEGLNALDAKKGTPPEQHDCCYTFGPIVDQNEHCNIFVYYYPKSEDINCF